MTQRVKTFMWLLLRKALLTNSRRVRCQITTDPNCDLCMGIEETWQHIFRDCMEAKLIWIELLGENLNDAFFTKDADLWIVDNLRDTNSTPEGIPWNV